MCRGQDERVVRGSFNCTLDCALWVGAAREESDSFALCVVPTLGEFLYDASGRLEGHIRTSTDGGKNIAEPVPSEHSNGKRGKRVTMTTPGDEQENNPADESATEDATDSTTEESTTEDATDSTTGRSRGFATENTRASATENTERPPHYRRNDESDEQNTGDEDSWALIVRDVGASLGAVALIGFYLFAISGVWPPMVAIESGSMEPNMNVNDLVFVMEADRFQPGDAQGDTGVVTAEKGDETGYTQFGDSGDVIVFAPNGNTDETPIIHRAMFWVEEGEDWTERADDAYLGSASSCADLEHTCPAPNDGFITKGDHNQVYDQVQRNDPVKSEWVIGTAEVQIPGLGWFRLQF